MNNMVNTNEVGRFYQILPVYSKNNNNNNGVLEQQVGYQQIPIAQPVSELVATNHPPFDNFGLQMQDGYYYPTDYDHSLHHQGYIGNRNYSDQYFGGENVNFYQERPMPTTTTTTSSAIPISSVIPVSTTIPMSQAITMQSTIPPAIPISAAVPMAITSPTPLSSLTSPIAIATIIESKATAVLSYFPLIVKTTTIINPINPNIIKPHITNPPLFSPQTNHINPDIIYANVTDPPYSPAQIDPSSSSTPPLPRLPSLEEPSPLQSLKSFLPPPPPIVKKKKHKKKPQPPVPEKKPVGRPKNDPNIVLTCTECGKDSSNDKPVFRFKKTNPMCNACGIAKYHELERIKKGKASGRKTLYERKLKKLRKEKEEEEEEEEEELEEEQEQEEEEE